MHDSAALARDFDKRTADEEEQDLYQRNSQDSLQSSGSRRSSASSTYSNSSVDVDDDHSRFVSFYEGLGWKQIVFIPHNKFWYHAVVVTIIIHFVILVYGYHFTNDETKILFYTEIGTVILVVIELMYFIDTALAIIYRNWKNIHKLNVHPPRPIAQLICDLFAVIPIEYIYWSVSKEIPMKTRVTIYYCLTSHSVVRIYRVFAFFTHMRNNIGYTLMAIRVIELFTYVFLMTHAFSAIIFVFYCRNIEERCYSKENDWSQAFLHGNVETDFDWFISSWYLTLGVFTFRSVAILTPKLVSILLFGLVFLTAFVVVYGFMMGQIVSAVIQDLQDIFSFSDRLKVIKHELIELRLPRKVCKEIMAYYQVLWENRGGVRQSYLHYELLPNILHRDLNLDIFGDAFKRSLLLRTANESFLSFLSLRMKAEFFLPGDMLYKKGQSKNKMIYLINGVIQVLSDEDDESPMISFSGGTCLGEASLVLDCVSKVVVRCATHCEVQVLHKSDFHAILKNYPQLNKSLQLLVKERIVKCKDLIQIGRKGLQPTDVVQLEDNTENSVRWFKNFFHSSLMNKKKRKSGIQQSVLQFRHINTCVHRTVAYLGLYVFTEQIELKTDGVCLQTTCPWILQPKSTVTKIWNNVIVIIALLVGVFLPYYAFYVNPPEIFQTLMYQVEIFYVLDVLIQTCTAIKTKTELITKWSDILYLRLSEGSFIADVITAFPLEVMAYMIHAGDNNYDALLMVNKLIKLWKVKRLLDEQEAKRISKTYLLRETKHVFYLVYAIYIFGGIFYFQSCYHNACETPGWYNHYHTNIHTGRPIDKTAQRNFTLSTLYASTLIIGSSFTTIIPVTVNDLTFSAFAMLFGLVFTVYISSATAAMELLCNKQWSMFQDTYKSITSFMHEHQMDGNLRRRVLAYLDFRWENDKAASLVSGRSAMFDLAPNLKDRTIGPALLSFLEKLPLFKEADYELVLQLANGCTFVTLPPNEPVIYSGEPANCAYIIQQGYCQVVASTLKSNFTGVLGPSYIFNMLEMVLKIPSANTVQTITSCQILQITNTVLQMVLKLCPKSAENVFRVTLQCSDILEMPEFKSENNNTNIFTTSHNMEENTGSWFRFPRAVAEYLTREDSEYTRGFAKLEQFSFISFFVLRRTMVPDGWFIIGWEIIRSVLAVVSAILFPAAGALEVYSYPWVHKFRIALDITAYLDIYMRLHVAFYDNRGIVVSHPLETAKHYLSHGFLLDLVSVFPFEIFALGREDLTLYYCLIFNRVFQISRPIRLFRYSKCYSKFARNMPTMFTGIQFLCVLLITCNVIGGMFVLLRCKYTLENTIPDRFDKGIFCENWNYAKNNEITFSEPLSPVRVYLYNVYTVTSLVTRCGVAVNMINGTPTAVAALLVTLFGFFFMKFMYARIIALTAAIDVKTTEHQEKMKALLNFIMDQKIHKEFRQEVVNYFELIWKRKKVIDAYTTFNGFHSTLKEDVFLHIYGKKLMGCSVFASAKRAFLCNLILSSHVEIFLRKSTILRPYELTTTIYFVNKGKVDLVAAGDVKACSSLTVGCMFGNLLNAVNYSHSLTVIARSHIEVLAIPCKEFHKQIALHPRIQKAFNNALEKSPSDFFIFSGTDKEECPEDSNKSLLEDSVHVSISSSTFRHSHVSKHICSSVLLPQKKFVQVMLALQLTASYITIFTSTYFLAHNEDSIYFLVFLYVLDLVFYIRIYMNFKLAYYDSELGNLVTDPAKIALRYLSVHTRIGFIYDVAAVIPIEAFGLLCPISYRIAVIGALRMNRILSSIYVLQWFWKQNNKLNINFFLIRFGLLLIWITMVIQICGWFLWLFSCLEKHNCYNAIGLNSVDRIRSHFRLLWIIVTMFVGSVLTSSELMPNSVMLIMYCIFIMMATRLMVTFAIGEACAIMESSHRAMTSFSGMVTTLCKFYTMNDLCPPLRAQLWSYLKLLWRMKKGQQVPHLLSEAPYYLREAIKSILYGDYVRRSAIFAECHEDFVRQLVAGIKQYIFFPGNYITFAGDVDDNMYFVYSGEVEFLMPTERDEDEDVRGVLVEGDAFGMTQGVYPRREHIFNYRARTVAILLILNRTNWESMLVRFPAVKTQIFSKAEDFNYRHLSL